MAIKGRIHKCIQFFGVMECIFNSLCNYRSYSHDACTSIFVAPESNSRADLVQHINISCLHESHLHVDGKSSRRVFSSADYTDIVLSCKLSLLCSDGPCQHPFAARCLWSRSHSCSDAARIEQPWWWCQCAVPFLSPELGHHRQSE